MANKVLDIKGLVYFKNKLFEKISNTDDIDKSFISSQNTEIEENKKILNIKSLKYYHDTIVKKYIDDQINEKLSWKNNIPD